MTTPGNKTEPYTPQDWSLNNIVELLVAERCAPLVDALVCSPSSGTRGPTTRPFAERAAGDEGKPFGCYAYHKKVRARQEAKRDA